MGALPGVPCCEPGRQQWEECVQRVLSGSDAHHGPCFITQRSHMARNNFKDWAREIILCARRILQNILVDKNYSNTGDYPGGPGVKNPLPVQESRVQSQVGELRSHVLRGN